MVVVVVEELALSAFFGFSGAESFVVEDSVLSDFFALPDLEDELLDLLSFL